jgi:hypothetical protein
MADYNSKYIIQKRKLKVGIRYVLIEYRYSKCGLLRSGHDLSVHISKAEASVGLLP